MFSLRGIFPNPTKDHKKNYIRENVKQLKLMQTNRANDSANNKQRLSRRDAQNAALSAGTNFSTVKSHTTHSPAKSSCSKQSSLKNTQYQDPAKVRKADMSEYLRRKSIRESRPQSAVRQDIPCPKPVAHFKFTSEDPKPTLKDVGCQYIDPDATHLFADGGKLRVIYPSKKVIDQIESELSKLAKEDFKDNQLNAKKIPASKAPMSGKVIPSRYLSNLNLTQTAGNTSIRSKYSLPSTGKSEGNRLSHAPQLVHSPNMPHSSFEKTDPLQAPSSYQKGVIPKYLRRRDEKSQEDKREPESASLDEKHFVSDEPPCPPGHIALPESERVETLKILKDKFIELVSELNKIPVRTDTLRMKTRKTQLDKEFTKLEEGIKVFSRKHVFVKIEV